MAWGIVVAALVAAGPAQAVQAPARSAPAAAPKADARARTIRIAVLDAQLSGAGDRKTVEGLSSLLASEVARRPELTVVAGSDLRALVGFERQKQLIGCTEASCLTEIAGALGVAYLVSSECSKVGNTWLLSLSLLDASRAVALKRLTRRAYSDDSLVDEAVAAVDELLTALPGVAPVPPRARTAAEAPRPPEAQGHGPPPGYHTHDGLYLGLALGFGGLRSKTPGISVSGPAGSFSIALGGSITRSLALYVQAFSELDTSPTFKNDVGSITVTNATHGLTAYGLGATWYLDPSNFFISATGAMSQVSLEFNNAKGSTKWGPALRVSAGKEWWVSSDWGLGAAVNFVGSSNKDSGAGATATFDSVGVSLSLSATYN